MTFGWRCNASSARCVGRQAVRGGVEEAATAAAMHLRIRNLRLLLLLHLLLLSSRCKMLSVLLLLLYSLTFNLHTSTLHSPTDSRLTVTAFVSSVWLCVTQNNYTLAGRKQDNLPAILNQLIIRLKYHRHEYVLSAAAAPPLLYGRRAAPIFNQISLQPIHLSIHPSISSVRDHSFSYSSV